MIASIYVVPAGVDRGIRLVPLAEERERGGAIIGYQEVGKRRRKAVKVNLDRSECVEGSWPCQ
jgi:hypothetical protein